MHWLLRFLECIPWHDESSPAEGWLECRKCRRVWECVGEVAGCLGEGSPIRVWEDRSADDLAAYLLAFSRRSNPEGGGQ